MPILQQREREAIRQRFDSELKQDVTITLYTQTPSEIFIPGRECKTCGPTQELAEEVRNLSRRVRLKIVDYYKNKDVVNNNHIDKIPAITVGLGERESARFYGMPSGYAFMVFIETLLAAASRISPLKLDTRKQLRDLKDDVHILVFVTPNCPHCPTVALPAMQMALFSPKVTTDVIEVLEFPLWMRLHNVLSVPKTVINNKVRFTGAASESFLLQNLLDAVGISREADGTEHVSGQATLLI